MRMAANYDEMAENVDEYVFEDLKKERHDDIKSFLRGRILVKVGDRGYRVDVLIGNKEDGRRILYEVDGITDAEIKEADVENGPSNNTNGYRQNTSAYHTNINPAGKESNRKNDIKYSVKVDSEGRELSNEQQEYFKDSQVVDENGNLRVVYHGTNYERFNIFDYDETGKVDGGFFGRGFYFAFSKGEAGMYGRNIIPAYLNIKNPFVFNEELYLLDGEKVDGYDESNAVFVMNLAEKVPEIAEKYTINTWPETEIFQKSSHLLG